MFRRFWRTEKCKHSLTLQSQWPESSSGKDSCVSYGNLLHSPAQRGFGSRSRQARSLPLCFPRVLWGCLLRKDVWSTHVSGSTEGSSPTSPSRRSPLGRAREAALLPPRIPVSGVTRLSLFPAAPPATGLCAPRAWGPGSLQTQTVRALFSSPGLRFCLLELIPCQCRLRSL